VSGGLTIVLDGAELDEETGVMGSAELAGAGELRVIA